MLLFADVVPMSPLPKKPVKLLLEKPWNQQPAYAKPYEADESVFTFLSGSVASYSSSTAGIWTRKTALPPGKDQVVLAVVALLFHLFRYHEGLLFLWALSNL